MEQASLHLDGMDYAPDALRLRAGGRRARDRHRVDLFRSLDLDRIQTTRKQPVLVDLRKDPSPNDMKRRGFTYVSVGRSFPPPHKAAF